LLVERERLATHDGARVPLGVRAAGDRDRPRGFRRNVEELLIAGGDPGIDLRQQGAMGLTREAYIERLYTAMPACGSPDGIAQIQRLVIGGELTGFSAVHG
jgi:alkylation response protein AidB-like acyl-CoA dehydrogenase